MIGIRFADPGTVKKMVCTRFVDDRTFTIPPGDPNYEVKANRMFLKDTLLLSFDPAYCTCGKNFKGSKPSILTDPPKTAGLRCPITTPTGRLRYLSRPAKVDAPWNETALHGSF